MLNDLTRLAVVAAVAASTIALRTADAAPSCPPRLNLEHAGSVDAAGGTLSLQGSAAAVRLETCQSTIADVLSALSVYNVSYRSSIALNEVHYGTYSGSLGQVIARVLDGYDYVIKHGKSRLDVIVYSKKGAQAVAAPIVRQVSQSSEPTPKITSRNR